jgi:hypothetical protein
MGDIFKFDVDFATSKDTLMAGEVVAGTRRVVVMADDFVDARLTAEQMVGATGVEPTGARLVGF